MKTIKIFFTDMWHGANEENFFLNFLKKHFNVVIDPSPDYLFYSVYGNEHLRYNNCIKIFYTGENVFPDFNFCDYAIGFHYISLEDRYLRFPLYVIYPGFEALQHKTLPDDSFLVNRKFCNFIYSNASNADPTREHFFKALNQYKKVDSGGRYLNNIGYAVPDKLPFIKEYKFTIAFENSSVKGYTSEKIMEPMIAGSMPVYWGNPLVHLDFNRASFVNVMEFDTSEDAIQEIIRLDSNDAAYLSKIKEPWLVEPADRSPWDEKLLHFFDAIFSQPLDAAKRKCEFGYAKVEMEERIFQAALLKKRKKLNHYKFQVLKNLWRLTGRKQG